MIPKNFCTTREAADLLGMSVSTVQLWVESGILQAWKTVGGHRRVLRDSVDALLQKKSTAAPYPALPQSPHASHTARPFKVLVVEDDVHLLRLYQAHLASWPMRPEVKLTGNAIAALLEVSRGTPDLLITDLHLPGMDGFNMLRVLSHQPELAPRVSIVAVTGLDATEIARRGGIPPGVEVFAKPIPFDRLLAKAAAIIRATNAPGQSGAPWA